MLANQMFTKVWPLQFIGATGNRNALLQTEESQWHLITSFDNISLGLLHLALSENYFPLSEFHILKEEYVEERKNNLLIKEI